MIWNMNSHLFNYMMKYNNIYILYKLIFKEQYGWSVKSEDGTSINGKGGGPPGPGANNSSFGGGGGAGGGSMIGIGSTQPYPMTGYPPPDYAAPPPPPSSYPYPSPNHPYQAGSDISSPYPIHQPVSCKKTRI
jgi:hypothetical protein